MNRETVTNQQQYSLGDLIKRIEELGTKKNNDEVKTVCFDFGTAEPFGLSSWRGDYSELGVNYRLSGYDNEDNHFGECKADEFLHELKEANGKEFTGWKGGEFKMHLDTPLWVANSGNGSHTAIVGVYDEGFQLVILTAYCHY